MILYLLLSMTQRDYYEILMVSKSASDGEIKKAYRDLAKKYHPDLNPGDGDAEAKFKEASEAYEVLKDPNKRTIYDQYGHQGLKNQGFSGFSNAEDIFSSFGDIFDSFFGFGGGPRSRRSSKGEDAKVQIEVTLEEVCTGTTKKIENEILQDCQTCDGTGAKLGSSPSTCSVCQGYGQVQQNRGFISIATTCPQCRGKGTVIEDPCNACHGQGRERTKQKIEVEIPAGIESGMHLRMQGKGHAGKQGSVSGDLYIEVLVKEHEHFERVDEHLYGEVKIGLAQASLGCTVKVPTLEGEHALEIPKGVQNQDQLVLPGKGLTILQRSRRGNLHFAVTILIPKRLSTKQEELLREFAKESGENVHPPKESFLSKLKKKK